MNKKLYAMTASFFFGLSFAPVSALAKAKCDLPEWRELSNEAAVLKAHPGIFQREGSHLKITLENGKTFEIDDRHEGDDPGAAYEIHRVIDVGPKGEWVTIFEPGSESFGYRIVHRSSGKVEELGGCPVWSKDGHHFVALHEDLESGRTQNEASLWYCDKPADSCAKTWSASEGGHDARWTGGKVQITLSKIDMNRKGQPEVFQTVSCVPKKANARCQRSKDWKRAGKAS